MKMLKLSKEETRELKEKERIEIERNGFTVVVEGKLRWPSDCKIYVVNPYYGLQINQR